jgi:serine-type D-Ala-D-Ala carboxypeptidase (penicillin-binding protein 5/6)
MGRGCCMARKVFMPVIFALITVNLLYISVFGQGPEAPDPEVSYAMMIDTDRGQIIYSKNPEEKFQSQIASIIMSAIMLIERQDRPERITVSSVLDRSRYNNLDLKVGEKHSFDDLLSVMLLRSAPDLLLVLADGVFASIETFVSLMNEKAMALEMKSTLFTLSESRYALIEATTNMEDLSKLLFYCLRNESFKRIISTKVFLWPLNEGESEIISNSNDLMWKHDYITGGIKSTHSSIRDTTTITTASLNNLNLLCILADDTAEPKDENTDILFRFAFDNFRRGILASKNSPITSIEINGIKLELSSNTDVYYTYPIGLSFIEQLTYSISEDIELPVMKNSPLGSANYTLSDGTVINVTLYPDRDILPEESTIEKIIENIMQYKELFDIIIFLLILEAILILYKIVRKMKKSKS